MKELFRTHDPVLIERALNLLTEHGIACWVGDAHAAYFHKESDLDIKKVMVTRNEEFDHARRLLSDIIGKSAT